MSVVQFPGDEPVSFWRCNCGCMTSFARSDGNLECANSDCGAVHENDGQWRIPARSKGKTREEKDKDTTIVDFNHPKHAKYRMKDIAEDETVLAIVIVREDGRVSTWGIDFQTDEQKTWIRENMDCAADELCKGGSAG